MGEQQPTILDDPKRTLTIQFTDLKIGTDQTGQLIMPLPSGGRLPNSQEVAEELARLNEDLPPDWAIICGWCKTHMRGPIHAINVNHGMCQTCLRDLSL